MSAHSETNLPGGARTTASPATIRRRRVVAGACLLALLVVLVSLIGGDSAPFGDLSFTLSPAQRAQLPWRQAYASGSAGPLDARGLPSVAAQQAAVERYYRLGQPIFCAGGRGKYAAITFDDGPSAYSGQIMQLLRRAGAQTTYFLIGENVSTYPGIPRQQAALGSVEDHTWTHPFLTRLDPAALNDELGRTKRVLEQATRTRVRLMRPPYGARDRRVDLASHRLGLLPILWDSDTRDSAGAASQNITQNAIAGLRPGGIVLLHETYDRTVAALPRILAAARRKGLRLVSIPQLLALDPPPDSQLRAGDGGCSERERYQRQDDAADMRLARSRATAPAARSTSG